MNLAYRLKYELEPAPFEPDLNRCLLISERVLDQITRPQSINSSEWRGALAELIWSELPAQQVMAYRLLNYIAKKEPWAQDVLTDALLDEATLEWAEARQL